MLSPADQELVSRDRALPALAMALDGGAIAVALCRALKRDDITTARVNYIRYKPATSCLSAATVVVDGQSHRLHVTALREGESAKIDKAIALSTHSALGAGALRLGADCLATFFPNDATVRSLARLSNPIGWRGMLARVFENDHAMLDAQWSVLAYKPDRRAALRLDVDAKPAAVLKLYGSDRFEAVRQRAKLFKSTDALRVPRRLGKSGGLSSLGLEWMNGRELTGILQNEPDAVADSIALTAAALADLHRQTSTTLEPARDHVRAALRAQIGAVAGLCPHLADRAAAMAEELDAHLQRRPIGAAAIHGDFYTKQVLIDSDCAAILDLDDAAIGEPEQDLGNFLGHLDW